MRRHTFCNDRPLFFGNSVPEHFLDGCSHEKLSFKTCFINHLGINSTIKKKKEFYWVSPAIFRNSFSIIFRPVSRCWGVFQRGNGSGRLEHGGTRAPARHQVRAFFFPTALKTMRNSIQMNAIEIKFDGHRWPIWSDSAWWSSPSNVFRLSIDRGHSYRARSAIQIERMGRQPTSIGSADEFWVKSIRISKWNCCQTAHYRKHFLGTLKEGLDVAVNRFFGWLFFFLFRWNQRKPKKWMAKRLCRHVATFFCVFFCGQYWKGTWNLWKNKKKRGNITELWCTTLFLWLVIGWSVSKVCFSGPL